MASVQYEVAYPAKSPKPIGRVRMVIDTPSGIGVHYETRPEALVTPVMAEVQRIMQEIRATGKCGMFVARWDGQAWCFHVCPGPLRVIEV